MPSACGSATSSAVTSTGPQGAKVSNVLPDHPLLAVLLQLPVAGRYVVADGVAGDVALRLLGRQVAAAFADDDDQLGLEIDLAADRGQHDGGVVADEGGGVLAEQDGVLRDGAPDSAAWSR